MAATATAMATTRRRRRKKKKKKEKKKISKNIVGDSLPRGAHNGVP